MKVISSLPTFEDFVTALLEMVADAHNSYDPQLYIGEYTLSEAKSVYTTDQIKELQEIMTEHQIQIKPAGIDKPFVNIGFDFVHTPNGNKNIVIPSRATEKSAGYDFVAPCDFVVTSEEPVRVKTGIKVYMPGNCKMDALIRSGLSSSLLLMNGVGLIDADYAYAPTTNGEIMLTFRTQPGILGVSIKAGERIAQGVITEYKTVDLDVPRALKRTGGHGSTGK